MNEENKGTVVIKIRFPKYLHDWIKKKAREEMRSMTQQIAFYIDRAFQEEKSLESKRASPETRADGRANDMGAEK